MKLFLQIELLGNLICLIDIDREKIARYGISIQDVQEVLKVAVGGMVLTQTVEGRERYGVECDTQES